MSYLPELFKAGDYATAIKVLDSMASEAEGPALASMLCNRALCYQKMDLHRKALKNYEEALKAFPTFARAHMGRGKALQALGRPKEAQAAWRDAIEGFSPADDLQLVEDAYAFTRNPEASRGRSEQQQQPPAASPSGHPHGPLPPASTNGTSQARSAAVVQQVPKQPAAKPAAKPQPAGLDTSMAVGMAVTHINAGRVEEALQLLDGAIEASTVPNMGALVARGTARALKRDLTGAIEDFSGSIAIYPNYGDAWKRRGQAKSANGDKQGALTDFERALQLINDDRGQAEIGAERAMIYQKDRDLKRAVKELDASVKLDAKNASAWNQLGLCRTGLGDIEEGCAAYRRAIALDPKMLDAWFNLAQARKEAAHVAEAEAAFKEVFKLLKHSHKGEHIRRVYSHMKQGMGEHVQAVKVLTDALETAQGPVKVECFFLRGACYHALGYHKKAIDDYSKAFLIHEENLPEEVRQQQVLAFFQKELVQYAHSHLDEAVAAFSLDRDIHPVFKELWCKKVPPSQSQLLACQHHPSKVPREDPGPPPPLPDQAAVARLAAAADKIGVLLQNHHQGFLPNKRQQRMGGLAALELVQAVRQLLKARRAGQKVMVTEGATVSPQAHEFGWRDAMDIVVKWRQLSEPNDQVIWVDLLTKAEFEAGFGSHTPMFSGQTKCVRYYMSFGRALARLKEILLKDGKAYNANTKPIPLGSAEKREAIRRAETAGDMWAAIGEDSWAVVPIRSSLHPGQTLEGTRLTVVKIPNQPDAYEMSIRTPVTPPRWRQYDEELSALWEKTIEALLAGDKPRIGMAVLTYCYYWYNFMPLARGTAVCGYITLLAMFVAADMPITAKIPKDYQVDWEAILNYSPADFIASLSTWLLPAEARPAANGAAAAAEETMTAAEGAGLTHRAEVLSQHADELMKRGVLDEPPAEARPAAAEPADQVVEGELDGLPSVKQLIPTLRDRLEILNGPHLPRL